VARATLAEQLDHLAQALATIDEALTKSET